MVNNGAPGDAAALATVAAAFDVPPTNVTARTAAANVVRPIAVVVVVVAAAAAAVGCGGDTCTPDAAAAAAATTTGGGGLAADDTDADDTVDCGACGSSELDEMDVRYTIPLLTGPPAPPPPPTLAFDDTGDEVIVGPV